MRQPASAGLSLLAQKFALDIVDVVYQPRLVRDLGTWSLNSLGDRPYDRRAFPVLQSAAIIGGGHAEFPC